jgi:phosphonatase-like hydrolase
MKTELAVFDLAGTTVQDNNDVPRVLHQVLGRNEVNVPFEAAIEVMGIPKPVAIKQLLLKYYDGTRDISVDWIDEIHREFVSGMIEFYDTDSFVEETEGTSEVFRQLKKHGIKVFVDTGFSRDITDVILRRMGWIKNGLIDGSVTSDEVKMGRPSPDMIFRAMELSNISSAKSVAKIGDTIADLMEGQNAGCGIVIGLTTGAHERSLLQQYYHTCLLDNIEQVGQLLISLHRIDSPDNNHNEKNG